MSSDHADFNPKPFIKQVGSSFSRKIDIKVLKLTKPATLRTKLRLVLQSSGTMSLSAKEVLDRIIWLCVVRQVAPDGLAELWAQYCGESKR